MLAPTDSNEVVPALSDPAQRPTFRSRYHAAAGKAFIVYLGSGSVILAIIAFLIFKGLHC